MAMRISNAANAQSKDEISVLASSFNRMRRSLQKAMQMLEG